MISQCPNPRQLEQTARVVPEQSGRNIQHILIHQTRTHQTARKLWPGFHPQLVDFPIRERSAFVGYAWSVTRNRWLNLQKSRSRGVLP